MLRLIVTVSHYGGLEVTATWGAWPKKTQSGAGIAAGPAASDGGSISLGSGPRGMWIDGEPLMHVGSGLGVIGAPAVRPDARRPRETLSRAQDDADWLTVEDERKTGHAFH